MKFPYYYNVWTKRLAPCLMLEKYVSQKNYCDQRDFINDEEKAVAILADFGTTVDEVYGYLKGEIDGMIDECLELNTGNSRFSKGNYGRVNVQPLKFEVFS